MAAIPAKYSASVRPGARWYAVSPHCRAWVPLPSFNEQAFADTIFEYRLCAGEVCLFRLLSSWSLGVAFRVLFPMPLTVFGWYRHNCTYPVAPVFGALSRPPILSDIDKGASDTH
jgi:hypothetical protein